jgi:hypothetical protein
MIVRDLNVLGARAGPSKADTKLVVDADAVLPGTVSLQCLQPVAWRNPKVIESAGDFQLSELATGDGFDVHETPNPLAVRQRPGVFAPERFHHARRY